MIFLINLQEQKFQLLLCFVLLSNPSIWDVEALLFSGSVFVRFHLFILFLNKHCSNIWAFIFLLFRSRWPFWSKAWALGCHLGHFKEAPFGITLFHVHVRWIHLSSLNFFRYEYLRLFFNMNSGSRPCGKLFKFFFYVCL